MGNSPNKTKTGVKLTPQQEEALLQLFHVRQRNHLPDITAELMQATWRDKMNDNLRDYFISYIFKEKRIVRLEELFSFYLHLTESDFDERAQFLLELLNHRDDIPPRTFQNFISDIIESYIYIIKIKCHAAYASWVTGDLLEKNDISLVSQYLLNEVELREGRVTVDQVSRWLFRCALGSDMIESILKVAFNLHVDDLKPFLPKARRPSGLLRVPLILTLSHLTQGLRVDWRLLYSSSTDAHSWNIFISKIMNEGPTLILIQDVDGPVFGGFASTSWRVSPTFYGTEECFLFRLRPNITICNTTGYNKNYQYLNTGTATLPNGLGMGGQFNYFGFFLNSDFGPGHVSKTCTTFRDYIPLASRYDFLFSRIEVWGIGKPPEPVEGERRSGLSMDTDPGAAALLEMTGKKIYSKNLARVPDEEEQ